jgi:g-D-glutamyl-meso-diaminopimelate peptidase
MTLRKLTALLLTCTLLFAAIPMNGTSVASAAGTAVVNPKQVYTYDIMVRDLNKLASAYPDLIELESIGKSEYGRDIWQADLGRGEAVVLLNGSHHAREWITTILLMTLLDRYAQAYHRGDTWSGHSVRELLDRVTFRFIPMVNPDGVTLQQKGLSAFPKEDHAALLAMNDGSPNFKRWKANAKGIDLNRQYPADWANIRDPEPGPHYMNYKGTAPLQAKEAQAMYDRTLETQPEIALAYHSSGEILYWHFHNDKANMSRDSALAVRYAGMTGYRVVPPASNPSGGGYTDWFIQQFGRSGLTPELARPAGEKHVPLSEWDRIWNQHSNTGWMLAEEAYNAWLIRQPVELGSGELRLTDDTVRAYKWPNPKSSKLEVHYAGRYKLLRTKGDWAEIETAAGARWIPARYALTGDFERLNDVRLTIDAETGVYDSPLAASPGPLRFAGQDVKALERWNDWYMIATWQGARWVQASETSVAQQQHEEI